MMEVVSSLAGDEREDGEIVDDEDVDFEEISDYSMPSCGKSDYSRNIIRAISLSSISGDSGDRDNDDQNHKYYVTCKKRNRRHGRVHVHKRRRRISISSSSEDGKLDSRTLKQLKEAVRINVSDEFHHNSLRTRLKGMIEPDSQDEECLRTITLITQSNDKPKNEDAEKDDYDKELSDLRLEALKSAFLKKYLERKRRKEINDKENEEHKKMEVEEIEEDIEEDEDVMRAMLLASMSKKITELPPSSTPIVHKHPPNKPTFIMKPLIINLNSDSDTNSDNNNKTQHNPKISENVTELLRKQREEFEAKEVAKEEALLDKSVVKLLSKAQQKEYQLLKEKLQQAKNHKKRMNGVHNKDESLKRKMLLEMQIQKDGRFQMKGKYKELAPLKKLVDQANLVRKQQDEKTKRLLKELNEAKLKLANDHKMYSNMVQKLLKAKENIDKRTIVNKNEVKAQPLVENTEAKNVPVEVTPPVDNNIIDTANEVSKYVSPLDHREIKQPTTNPLEFLCPYELFGVCRDKDCNFNHCT